MTSDSAYFHPIDHSESVSKGSISPGYHVQMPVYSPEEVMFNIGCTNLQVIHMIETVSADPKVKDELTGDVSFWFFFLS